MNRLCCVQCLTYALVYETELQYSKASHTSCDIAEITQNKEFSHYSVCSFSAINVICYTLYLHSFLQSILSSIRIADFFFCFWQANATDSTSIKAMEYCDLRKSKNLPVLLCTKAVQLHIGECMYIMPMISMSQLILVLTRVMPVL